MSIKSTTVPKFRCQGIASEKIPILHPIYINGHGDGELFEPYKVYNLESSAFRCLANFAIHFRRKVESYDGDYEHLKKRTLFISHKLLEKKYITIQDIQTVNFYLLTDYQRVKQCCVK